MYARKSRFGKDSCWNHTFEHTYHRIEFGMALARHLGIPITNRPFKYMIGDEETNGCWDDGILFLPDNRQSELFHEIGHWVEGRERKALHVKNYGLSVYEDSPKLEITAEGFAQVIEWVLLQAADVATDRMRDILDSAIREQKWRVERGDA